MQEHAALFSSRADQYRKYRPHYPPQMLDWVRGECGLAPEWSVADIGSGTGISSELFLQNGNRVFAVEPNAEMRRVAEAAFTSNPNFISLDGTAEATALPDACVDLVAVGQAFHWFDPVTARGEFRRILKPGGWVAIFFYVPPEDSGFSKALGELFSTRTATMGMQHRPMDLEELAAFFSPGFCTIHQIETGQFVDYETVEGGFLSSAYAPKPGDPQYKPMLDALRRIFTEHAHEGKVPLPYNTMIYTGRLVGE